MHNQADVAARASGSTQTRAAHTQNTLWCTIQPQPQALEMFTSLCMFEEAKQLAEQAAGGQLFKGGQAGRGAAAVAELMGKQALWSEETANYEAAVEMYIKVRGAHALHCCASHMTCCCMAG